MRSAPDTTPTCAPHSFGASGIALDSGGVLAIGIGASPLSAHITHPLRAAWAKSRLISQVERSCCHCIQRFPCMTSSPAPL